jgi:hypothetical protein
MMISWLVLAFFVGGLVGKNLHLMTEDRCYFVGEVEEYGKNHPCRCTLRDLHEGPHRLRYMYNGHILPASHWIPQKEEES